MLTARVFKPVHEATPWINSFILVESTDKSTDKPKLCTCLDPTNLNKAIIHEPYCFHTTEDIAHKLSGATVINSTQLLQGILASTTRWWIQFLNYFQHQNWLIQIYSHAFWSNCCWWHLLKKIGLNLPPFKECHDYSRWHNGHRLPRRWMRPWYCFHKIIRNWEEEQYQTKFWQKFNTYKKKWNFWQNFLGHRDLNPMTQKSKP